MQFEALNVHLSQQLLNTPHARVVIRRLPSMAAHRTLLWLWPEKMLRRWKRILKLWNISHMLMVKKAMVMPWGETPEAHHAP